MTLTCIAPIRNSYGAWQPGDVIDDPALEAHLLADSPESFAPFVEKPKATAKARAEDEPEAHRMVTRETPGARRRTSRKAE